MTHIDNVKAISKRSASDEELHMEMRIHTSRMLETHKRFRNPEFHKASLQKKSSILVVEFIIPPSRSSVFRALKRLQPSLCEVVHDIVTQAT